MEDQLDILVAPALRHDVCNPFNHLPQVEIQLLNGEPAGLDFRQIENVIDQSQKRVSRRLDCHQVVPLLVREFGAQGQLSHADDPVHGRAYLMAHVGQKLGLGQIGLFRFDGQPIGSRHGALQLAVAADQRVFGRLALGDVFEALDAANDLPFDVAYQIRILADKQAPAIPGLYDALAS